MEIKKNDRFISTSQIFIAIFTIFIFLTLIFVNLTRVGYSADVSGFSVSGLEVDYTNGTWASSGNNLKGSATGTAAEGCDDATFTTSTLTLTNVSGETKTLKFDYDKPSLGTGGSVEIDGTSVTAAGSFEKELQANASISIVIVSGDSGAYTSSIEIKNIALVSSGTIEVTFYPATSGGTYTVNGTLISDSSGQSISSDQVSGFNIVFTPSANKKIYGLKKYGTSNYQCYFDSITNNSYNLLTEVSLSIQPEFCDKDSAIFKVGNKMFLDLNDANSAATSGDKKIVLVNTGIITEGEYTISSGNTLLIPKDSNYNIVTEAPTALNSYTKPSVYKKLQLDGGVELIVNGSISLASDISKNGQYNGHCGQPTGTYGCIEMLEGSIISLNDGSNLYAWGYIYGPGDIHAYSGSTVYECFVMKNWPGGNNALNMKNNSERIFLINQYYIPNIESNLYIYKGATEKVTTALYMKLVVESSPQPILTLIGDSGLFNISEGYLIKRYDSSSDRLLVDIYGSITMGSIDLSMTLLSIPVNLNSADCVLPISSNLSITLKDDAIITTNQDLAFLPGSELIIDSGATFKISNSNKVYVYDRTEWVNNNNTTSYFAGANAHLYVIDYMASINGKPSRSASNLLDAKIDVNGELIIENGSSLYTTKSGANICSSNKTGKITYLGDAPAAGVTYQYSNGTTDIAEINVNSAYLKNGNSTYTKTDNVLAGTVIQYSSTYNRWGWSVLWKNSDGTELERDQNLKNSATYSSSEVDSDQLASSYEYNGNTPTKADSNGYSYTFDRWNPTPGTITSDKVYTATYTQTPIEYTITYELDGGSNGLGNPSTYNVESSTIVFSDAIKSGYSFEGWYTDSDYNNPISEITSGSFGNLVIYAKFVENLSTYTIKFVNHDGTELQSSEVAYGETPSYNGETPTKAADAQYTYTFNGWDPTITSVTGEATYTATYTSTLRTYTVTWNNFDGYLLEKDLNVPYGTIPEYNGETPIHASSIQYTYAFSGWNPSIEEVTGDVIYTAKFTEVLRSYTIRFIHSETNEVLQSSLFDYGVMPSYSGTTPSRTGYNFDGWNPGLTTVVGDKDYSTKWAEIEVQYSVKHYLEGLDGSYTLEKTENFYAKTNSKVTPEVKSYAGFTAPAVIEATVLADGSLVVEYNYTRNSYNVTFSGNGNEVEYSYKYQQTFNIPTASELSALNGTYRCQLLSFNGLFYDFGDSFTMNYTESITFVAVYSGWLTDNEKTYYVIPDKNKANTAIQYASGLYSIENESVYNTYLFDPDDDNALSTKSGLYHHNNNIYYLSNGIVEKNKGLVQVGSDYYYFGESNIAYKSGEFYITTDDAFIKSGYYTFDSNGKIVIDDTPSGLYLNGSYYSYRLDDDTNLVNSMIYLTDENNNGIKLTGLYYLNSNGYLCNLSMEVVGA